MKFHLQSESEQPWASFVDGDKSERAVAILEKWPSGVHVRLTTFGEESKVELPEIAMVLTFSGAVSEMNKGE